MPVHSQSSLAHRLSTTCVVSSMSSLACAFKQLWSLLLLVPSLLFLLAPQFSNRGKERAIRAADSPWAAFTAAEFRGNERGAEVGTLGRPSGELIEVPAGAPLMCSTQPKGSVTTPSGLVLYFRQRVGVWCLLLKARGTPAGNQNQSATEYSWLARVLGPCSSYLLAIIGCYCLSWCWLTFLLLPGWGIWWHNFTAIDRYGIVGTCEAVSLQLNLSAGLPFSAQPEQACTHIRVQGAQALYLSSSQPVGP